MSVPEHAVFVPFGSDRLAGVLTLPHGDPTGVVLLLDAQGTPRSLRQN